MPKESVPSVGESDFREAAALLLSRRRPVLVTHDRPDGAGLGCLLAMRAILADLGRPATAGSNSRIRRPRAAYSAARSV